MKDILRRPFKIVSQAVDSMIENRKMFVVGQTMLPADMQSVKERFRYYMPDFPPQHLVFTRSLPWRVLLDTEAILVFGKESPKTRLMRKLGKACFNIDWNRQPTDGWEWVRLANSFYGASADTPRAKASLEAYTKDLLGQGLKKCYLFGTGPSLEKAITMDWSDGYRIVCNTIVKDAALWRHINPHFIVAGDAIYHFGHTAFARAFRRDLLARLKETSAFFVYPGMFDYIARRELSEVSSRLIPIPDGQHHDIHVNLVQKFELPFLGNVLPLLLLPLGCTMSKSLYLWGFNGRSPDDTLFWANSQRHTYPEFLSELRTAHPKFFEYYVPTETPNQYVDKYHGNDLEQRLCAAESEGYTFVMMHPSWTPTLHKRYQEPSTVDGAAMAN